MKKFTQVSIDYVDHPSLDQQDAAIIYGSIVEIVKPKKRLFTFWQIDAQTIEIEATNKQQLQQRLIEAGFTEGDGGIVELQFSNQLALSIDSYERTYQFVE